jgi:beta-lactamase regulating signal transducer with metallopeptidase domain
MGVVWFSIATAFLNVSFNLYERPRIGLFTITFGLCVVRMFVPIEIIGGKIYHSWNLYPIFQKVIRGNTGEVLLFIWGVGIIVAMIWLFRQFMMLHNIRKRAVEYPENSKEKQMCSELLVEMNYTGKFSLAKTKDYSVPISVGYFHPCILFPDDMKGFSEEEFQNILRHEITHFLEKDLWIKLLCLILRCLLWWNPIIYFACKNIEQLTELRCDRKVYCNLSNKEQVDYLKAIYHTIKSDDNQNKIWSGFNGVTINRYWKQRVALLREPHKRKEWGKSLLGIGLALVLFLASYAVILQPTTLPNYDEIEGDNVRGDEEEFPILLEVSEGVYIYFDEEGVQGDYLTEEQIQKPPYNELEIVKGY